MFYHNKKDAPGTVVGRLETSEEAALQICEHLTQEFTAAEAAVSLSEIGRGRWDVALYFLAPPDEKALRALIAGVAGGRAAATLRFRRIAAKDWVAKSLAGLKPVAAGRFIVHGAHDRAALPPNRIAIEIEAALAFGTGHHGTTRGCLLALDRICKHFSVPSLRMVAGRGRTRHARYAEALNPTGRSRARHPPSFGGRNLKVLDLGTGSGVLAIAAARALRQRVLATDIDPSAVRVARANARHNQVGGFVEVVKADGATARSVRRHAPFGLIFANILLRPLLRLAVPLKSLIAPGGRIVLSGLLSAHANAVISACRPLALEHRIDLDGWATLIFRHRRRAVPRIAGRSSGSS